MSALLLALSVSLAQAPERHLLLATNAIRVADEVVAESKIDEVYWKYGQTGGLKADASEADKKAYDTAKRQYEGVLDAVHRRGSFVKPIRMSLVIKSARTDDLHQIHLGGTFQAYAKMIEEYWTPDEVASMATFDAETKQLEEDIGAEVANGDVSKKDIRLHQLRLSKRVADREQWREELASIARPRKDFLELVKVSVLIPEDMARTIDIPRLLSAKRVLITIQVEDFALRGPLEELKSPPAIGSLIGTATDIVQYMRKKP